MRQGVRIAEYIAYLYCLKKQYVKQYTQHATINMHMDSKSVIIHNSKCKQCIVYISQKQYAVCQCANTSNTSHTLVVQVLLILSIPGDYLCSTALYWRYSFLTLFLSFLKDRGFVKLFQDEKSEPARAVEHNMSMDFFNTFLKEN